MKLTDEQIEALRVRAKGVTPPGPWEVERFRKGSIPHVVGHGLYVCGTHLNDRVRADYIASCHPDTVLALATEVLETRALLASFDEDELEQIITDSIDLDWTPRDAAKAIVRAMKGGET